METVTFRSLLLIIIMGLFVTGCSELIEALLAPIP